MRVTWSYDNLYQLTRERRSGTNSYDVTYTYDKARNRLTQRTAGVTTTYSYNGANQLLWQQDNTGRTTYTYDAVGNQTSKVVPAGSQTRFTWDFESRLAQVVLPTGGRNTFLYRADGKRVEKDDSMGTTKYVWDFENVLLETDKNNVTQALYTLKPQDYGPLLSQLRGGISSFFLLDGMGSTDRLTNSAQMVTDQYNYQAFGAANLTSGTTVNPFRFAGSLGYYEHPDINVLLLRARYYDPSIGKFVSRDPLASIGQLAMSALGGLGGGGSTGLAQGISSIASSFDPNLFAYVGNRATVLTDPSGLQALTAALGGFLPSIPVVGPGVALGGLGGAIAGGAGSLLGNGIGGVLAAGAGVLPPGVRPPVHPFDPPFGEFDVRAWIDAAKAFWGLLVFLAPFIWLGLVWAVWILLIVLLIVLIIILIAVVIWLGWECGHFLYEWLKFHHPEVIRALQKMMADPWGTLKSIPATLLVGLIAGAEAALVGLRQIIGNFPMLGGPIGLLPPVWPPPITLWPPFMPPPFPRPRPPMGWPPIPPIGFPPVPPIWIPPVSPILWPPIPARPPIPPIWQPRVPPPFCPPLLPPIHWPRGARRPHAPRLPFPRPLPRPRGVSIRDYCHDLFLECLETSLADLPGRHRGERRCEWCLDSCIAAGGNWRGWYHPPIGGRRLWCDYWNYTFER
jgi:RHS repeat-associated protein